MWPIFFLGGFQSEQEIIFKKIVLAMLWKESGHGVLLVKIWFTLPVSAGSESEIIKKIIT